MYVPIEFADARGHKIERHNYLDALKNLSSTPKGNIVNKIPENESIPQEPNTRSTNSRERVSRDNGSISNWRTVKRKPHSPGPSYQDSRNRYSWRNSEDYNDKQPSPSKRMYDGNMNHQRSSNFEYNQQCRRQTYQFQNMEFRGRSEQINNNRNASHHNNSVDRDHRRRPQEISYRQREESSSTHRGASQNGQNSYASRHHTSYKPLPRGDNRNFRRPPSPASTSRERFTDNSYRNRR